VVGLLVILRNLIAQAPVVIPVVVAVPVTPHQKCLLCFTLKALIRAMAKWLFHGLLHPL
jgi:hypothetical protein